jgi:hypothetical protein
LGKTALPIGHPLATDIPQRDPELAAVINAWAQLPEAVRTGIAAIVKAAADKQSPV